MPPTDPRGGATSGNLNSENLTKNVYFLVDITVLYCSATYGDLDYNGCLPDRSRSLRGGKVKSLEVKKAGLE